MNRDELKTIAQVWQELNSIKARDGAPSGVCPEYWSDLTERVRDLFESNIKDGKSVHCHPILYETEAK